jgi:HEAT repeat protein
MRRFQFTISGSILTFGCLLLSGTALGAGTNDEARLIQVLQSDATPAEKDAACARLKFFGTARCVPAVAALLTDEQLSHSARYTLESMNVGEAGTALLKALSQTTGPTRVGIINSLAMRGEPRAVPPLTGLLHDSDPVTVVAAADALGTIGGPRVLKPLQALEKTSSGQVHRAAVDAMLRYANGRLLSGSSSRARPIFEYLHGHEGSYAIRLAAYRGFILASGNNAADLVVQAVRGPDGPERTAALQCIHEVPDSRLTRSLADLLPELEPSVQLAVVEGLQQRGDPAAAPALATLATHASPEVVLAILRALGPLGNASTVPLLADFAASPEAGQQKTARVSLVQLNRGPVTETLLTQLTRSSPAVQNELVRALGERGDRAAVPKLFELVEHGPESVRAPAYQALGLLAEQPDVGTLVRRELDAKDPTERAQAADALSIACRHIQDQRGTLDAQPLLAGLATGSAEARAALMPVCSDLVSPQVRLTLRTAIEDSDEHVRAAATHALCETADPDLLDDLVALARHTKDENVRSQAIAGGVRLTGQDESLKLSNGRRVAVLKELLIIADRPEQKRRVLSGLAEVPLLDALKTVETALDDPAVQTEASRAALQIAVTLPSSQSQDALAVLNKALSGASDERTRSDLEAGIKQIEASADYITDWQFAGPYRQSGKDYRALFEAIFPPETGDDQSTTWRFLPPGADPKRPWVMDLLKASGPQEQCVAFARTWVHCDKDLKAQLELGTDDGVKAWLNDKQVYALNTSRALRPGSDKTEVDLHSGWNRLLLKVTQNNQGWEFCARFRSPDGSHLDGLQCDTSHGAVQAASAEATNEVQSISQATPAPAHGTNQIRSVSAQPGATALGTNQPAAPVGATNQPGAAVQNSNPAQPVAGAKK